jgi:hypothetical protein
VKFWDASAIVPLLVAKNTTRSLRALANRDSDLLVWWGSQVECASALARLEPGALLDMKGAASAFDRLKQLANGWHEIEPSEIIRENALRFLRIHPLRAAPHCSLRRRSLRPNDVLHRLRLSRSTTVSATQRGRKVSS